MQTREQRFAAKVYRLVAARNGQYNETEKNKYGSMAHKLPVLIRSAGLAQALAFVATRSDTQKDVLPDLAVALGFPDAQALLKSSREADLAEYMLLTEQSLGALLWFKRYAESVLGVTADQEGGNND
ncbi:type III-B CRISPR module-associated protein Cmr5 [Roseiflexus sp.]|uniref:type III-B CRISPR module-associated protein Cmr5 n=1 Tax=Roseiflexus sp. TaxID=2562120 RepID=UPI00398A8FBD